jgi:NAD(P)-dependent dehydrogenase (short-subunit alcohol dehydrogenase family)
MAIEKFELTDKAVIVTGAGRGLGREMSLSLARAGANIAAVDIVKERVDSVAKEIETLGRKVITIGTDVRDSKQVDAMVHETIREFGRVDVMLSNAGIGEGRGLRGAIWEVTDDDWRDNLDVNLSSAFYCTRAVARPMIDQGGGVIILLSSGTALRGSPIFPYSAPKAGIIALTKSFALLLVRYNIRVNCIIPGEFARRPSADAAEEKYWEDRGKFFPARRVGEPRELGPLAVFLASDASSYITGQGFPVEGGFLSAGLAPVGFVPTSSCHP